MRRTKAFSLALTVAFLAMVVPTRGQEKEASQKTAPEGQTRKVVSLRYADPNDVARLLGAFGTAMVPDRRMKVVTVVGGASAVQAVEEAINKLDVPPPPTKDIDFTAYFVLATRQPADGPNLPKELDEVVNQLKRVLNYQGFSLLNTALIRTRDGEEAWVSGVASTGVEKADFHFGFTHAYIIPEGKVAKIRIINLEFVMERPVDTKQAAALAPRTTSAKIHTDIDVPEGQKVVVGKTSFDSPDNALVLVLTAKVLD